MSQRQYYLGELNRSLPVAKNPADNATIQAALGSVDPVLPPTVRQAASEIRFLSDFGGATSEALRREAECRAFQAPSMSMREPDARTGCGWWFSPSGQSTGSYGTRRGPMSPNLDTQFGAGQWVWNTAQAMQMESQKQAASVASCPDIAYAQRRFPTMAWCTATNSAMLLDQNGNPVKPNDCTGGQLITQASACPAPTPGVPSAGGGSSISGNCNGGTMTPACMYSVAANTCKPQGYLATLYNQGTWPSQDATFNQINQTLQKQGFTIDSRLLNPTQISTNDAITAVQAIATAANQPGQDPRVASAAQYLCNGTPYNPCAIGPNDPPPYPPQCVTQYALSKGYSPQGTSLPGNSGAFGWNDYPTWGQLTAEVDWLKTAADNPAIGGPNQPIAIQQVYGVNVQYPKQSCNTQGVYLYRYSFPGMWQPSLFPAAGPLTHFLGRYLLKNGIPSYGSNYNDQLAMGGNLEESQRMRFTWIPSQGQYNQFQVQTDNVVNIYTQQGSAAPSIYASIGGPTTENTAIVDWMTPGQPINMLIDFINRGGQWSFGLLNATAGTDTASSAYANLSTFQPLPATEIFLPRDRRQPMIDLSFHKMQQGTNNVAVTDVDGVLQTLSLMNAPIGSLNGRTCMVVQGRGSGVFNCMTGVNQGLRLGGLKSITMMYCVTGNDTTGTGVPTLFSLYNLPSSAPYLAGAPRITSTGGPQEAWEQAVRPQNFCLWTSAGSVTPYMSDTTNSAVAAAWASAPVWGSGIINQWMHVAFVWDSDMQGYTLYVNGNSAGASRIVFSPTQLYEQIRIGCDMSADRSWTGGIQWFRAFDYQLSQAQVQMDMQDGWSVLN